MAGMHQDLREPVRFARHRVHDGRDLHEVGPRAHDVKDLHRHE